MADSGRGSAGQRKRSTVPELYRKAAKVLKQAELRKESVKNLIYSSGFRDIKPLYALVAESIKHRTVLEGLIGETNLGERQPAVDLHLAKIILELEADLRHRLDESTQAEEPAPIRVPRYVRVNTLKCSVGDALEHLISEGWRRVRLARNATYADFIERVQSLKEDEEFLVDFHLDYLLVFPCGAQFHQHPLLKNGSFLLQDKASCLSAVALTTESDGHILDACAAPGMKTSLLAALSRNPKSVTAVERDVRRSQLLRRTLQRCGAGNVQVLRQDFLQLDPAQFDHVEYILVDPSCSGSGIVKRFESAEDAASEEGQEEARLKKLSNLQCRMLAHASRFRNVRRIVYSTCSVHVQENELVVRRILDAIAPAFRLETAIPDWPRRGLKVHDDAEHSIGELCVRADARLDLTNGFFIAAFVRC